MHCCANHSRLRNSCASGSGTNQTANFSMSAHQEFGESVTLHKLLALCLSENERRLAGYDARLRRPRLVPALARFAYRILPSSI